MTARAREAFGDFSSGGSPGLGRGSGVVGLPARIVSPLVSVLRRGLFALALVGVAALLVYAQRSGYRDSAHPGEPLSFLGSWYYATVTMTTTGYGDIVPVTGATRLENTILITPLRVAFLIALVGTTLSVLTEQTRTGMRVARWRSVVKDHTIVVGFGTKGRSAAQTLRDSGVLGKSIVVVDSSSAAVHGANLDGLAGVMGDATRRGVLAEAGAAKARRIVIAVARDDTAVLITLTARQLNATAMIVVTIREAENEALLHQSGADHVIVSAETAGRMLGMTAMDSAVGDVLASMLSCGAGIDLVERQVDAGEVGVPPARTGGPVIAVVRDGIVMAPGDPRLESLATGDRLVLTAPSATAAPAPGADTALTPTPAP